MARLQHADDPSLRSDLANAYERVGIITDGIGARPDALAAHRHALDIRAALARDHPENAGLLREITGYARNRRFRFDPYLRLFEEPEEARA